MEYTNKLAEIEAIYKESMKAKASALNANNQEVISSLDARIASLKLIKSELIHENQKVYECAEYKMTEAQEIAFLNSMAEARKENVKTYHAAGRTDLETAEAKELGLINEFLPQLPSEEELKEFISNKIDEYLASQEDGYVLSMKDMSKIKPIITATYQTVNGKLISAVLMSKINGNSSK